jgi:replicative DNA helicase
MEATTSNKHGPRESISEFLAAEGIAPKNSAHAPDADPLIDGKTFIFDAPPLPESVWGDGRSRVLMARGEGTMFTGPQGIGKTTLAQQLVLKRIGIGDPDLLGYAVAQDGRKVLYLAMDRPRQIARMFRRGVKPEDGKILEERLVVCVGALPFALNWDKAGQLAEYAQEVGAGMIVADSYKDLASNLSDEETGALINRIVQAVVAADIEWLGVHHPRKAQGKSNPKPNTLGDVFGSMKLTAGLGSVIGLWGTPGDPIVEFTHLKIPAEPVNLGAIRFDHSEGTVRAVEGPAADSSDTSSMHQLLILNALSSRPVGAHITLAEAEGILGRSERTVRRVLRAMADHEPALINEHGATTNKTWSLPAQQI